MKLYFASGLENARNVQELAAYAVSQGHELTYVWWLHGSVQDEGPARIAEVGNGEMAGVAEADAVLVLLPGGRGTHAEMGGALALGKPTFIYGPRKDAQGRECSFYYHDSAIRMNGAEPKWLLDVLSGVDVTQPQWHRKISLPAAEM